MTRKRSKGPERFFLAHDTFVMGVGLPPIPVDTDTLIRCAAPHVYYARLTEPFKLGELSSLYLEDHFNGRMSIPLHRGTVRCQRAKSGAVVIDIRLGETAPSGLDRFIVVQELRTSEEQERFLRCDCHYVARRGAALCLAHRILTEIRETVRTTPIRI